MVVIVEPGPWDWTPEQLSNAQTYGLCLRCRAPCEARTVDGATDIVCPNGHAPQHVRAELHAPPLPPPSE